MKQKQKAIKWILVIAVVSLAASMSVASGQQQVVGGGGDKPSGSHSQKEIKEELSRIDIDAAIELTEKNVEGSKLLDSLAGQPDFMAGQDVPDKEGAATEMDPMFTEAELEDDANAIIRMSHAGWVDQEYFESYIVPAKQDTIKFDQIWFLYLFHSRCKTKACMLLNEAYEYIFIDWLNSTRTVGIDLDKEDTPRTKFARENVKIGRVNCKKFKREICERIMMKDQ